MLRTELDAAAAVYSRNAYCMAPFPLWLGQPATAAGSTGRCGIDQHPRTAAIGYRLSAIAHLAETPFGFSTSTLLPITPQTPKHLGFGVIMPFRVRRDTPFGLKTPASWRNGFFDSELFDLRYPANGIFNFRRSYFSAVQVKTNAP